MFGDDIPGVLPGDIDARRAAGWVLLDVRTDTEWQQARIAGSIHVPMDQIVARLEEIPERVVCVCAVGARSARVAEFLGQRGHEAVNLDGGLLGWVQSGRPLDGDEP